MKTRNTLVAAILAGQLLASLVLGVASASAASRLTVETQARVVDAYFPEAYTVNPKGSHFLIIKHEALRLADPHLGDLERAQPPAVPRPAVQRQGPPPALAGDLPPAVPGGVARAARVGQRARPAAHGGDRASGHRQGRRAADVPARRAVPQQPLRQAPHVLEPARRRLRRQDRLPAHPEERPGRG